MSLSERFMSEGLRQFRESAPRKPPTPSSLSMEDSLPVFLTGSLPKRDPAPMYEFILCVRRLGIQIPKDIYRMIYEELRLVALDKASTYYSRIPSNPVLLALYYDFVILNTVTDGVLSFNDLQYHLPANSTYFLFTGALRHLSVSIVCKQFRVQYHSFIDRDSPVCSAIYSISGLNSNLGPNTVMYLNHSVQFDNCQLLRLPKEKFKAAIDICLRHGLVSLEDKLKREHVGWLDHDDGQRKPLYWTDHHGHPIGQREGDTPANDYNYDSNDDSNDD